MPDSQAQPVRKTPYRLERSVRLTAKQSQAFDILTSLEDAALLYGGAKGGGKDFLFCVWVKVWVEWLIRFFDLSPSRDPVALGFVGRKRSVDFRDTTLEEFKRIIPPDHYRLHNDAHEIVFMDTAKVFCGGLDDPKRIEKFNSANLAFLAINQAEETERTDVSVLRAALRLKIGGKQPPYKELYTANPADCWLKEDFISAPQPKHYFVPALYNDNPHLPDNYCARLESAFRWNDALLRAYRDGDWSALETTNTLITHTMLESLKDYTPRTTLPKRLVSCDPSLGGDECRIQKIDSGAIVEQKILHERDPMKVAGELVIASNQFDTPWLTIDYSGGLGEAIAARVREVKPGCHIHALNSSERAPDEKKFANLRSEMWWYAMRQIQDKKVPFPEDEELRRQLAAVRFRVVDSNGKIALEPKDDTKSRLGCSPDRADAYVMGLYDMQYVQTYKPTSDRWQANSAPREISLGAGSFMAA